MTPGSGSEPARTPLRVARIIWTAFLCCAVADIAVARFGLKPPVHAAPSLSLSWAFAAIGAADILVIAGVRLNALSRSKDQAKRGETAAAKQSWFSAQVIGFAGGLSIVLLGFVLYLLGAQPAWISTVFFVAGLVNLAVIRPQSPESR
jgi:hypothetical protein